MDAWLGLAVLLGAVMCMSAAVSSDLYPSWQVIGLGALNLLIVVSAPRLRSGDRLRMTCWQLLVAGAVLVAAARPHEPGHLLATDHVLTIACGVTTFRGGKGSHAGMVAVIVLSTAAAGRVVGQQQAISAYLYLLCFYAVMIAVFRVIVTSATRTDEIRNRVFGATREELVSSAVLRDREERARVLHDTVLATLTAVTQGIATDPAHVRARCAADLALLNSPTLIGELVEGADLTGAAVAEAIGRAVAEAARLGLTIREHHDGVPGGTLPVSSADALVGAATEALANVRRHSGVAEAEMTLRWARTEVRLLISDRGRGFDPVRVAFGLGLRKSVLARARAAGGSADIRSDLGMGTTIEVTVPTSAAAE